MNWLPPFVLGLWGAVLLQAWGSGRLNLLLQADFHWLVLVSGLLLLALAGLAGGGWGGGGGGGGAPGGGGG